MAKKKTKTTKKNKARKAKADPKPKKETLLGDILGAEPEEQQPLDLERALALGRKLHADLKPLVDGFNRGDKLISAAGFYRLKKRYKWCPDSAKAVATELARQKLVPAIKGERGRKGRPHYWWFSQVMAVLRPPKNRR